MTTQGRVTPLGRTLGARIDGMDLAAPLDEAGFEFIHQVFLDWRVIAIPGQHLTPDRIPTTVRPRHSQSNLPLTSQHIRRFITKPHCIWRQVVPCHVRAFCYPLLPQTGRRTCRARIPST